MSVARCVPVLMLREAEAEDGEDENDSREGEEEEAAEIKGKNNGKVDPVGFLFRKIAHKKRRRLTVKRSVNTS